MRGRTWRKIRKKLSNIFQRQRHERHTERRTGHGERTCEWRKQKIIFTKRKVDLPGRVWGRSEVGKEVSCMVMDGN